MISLYNIPFRSKSARECLDRHLAEDPWICFYDLGDRKASGLGFRAVTRV